jgi:iron complex outermembrane receptor protein
LSGSVFDNAGEGSIYLPEFDTPQTNFGRAVNMDGERGYHLFANLAWNNWSFLFMATDRLKVQPVSYTPTIFNDPGTRIGIGGTIADLAYTRDWGRKTFEWHTYYEAYRFLGTYHSALAEGVEDTRERNADDWVGTKASLRFAVPRIGTLTVGAEAKFDIRTMMSLYDLQPAQQEWQKINRPNLAFAAFLQDEVDLSKSWKLDLGARGDTSRYGASFVSPRAALIYQRSASSAYKLLYGRSFRSPTAYEMFFGTAGMAEIGNPSARPEKADTLEFVAEHRIRKTINTSVSLYDYRMKDMLVGVYLPSGALQYQNAEREDSLGIEFEAGTRVRGDIDFSASMAFQRTVDDHTNLPLPNSPGQVGKLRAAIPLFADRITLATGMQFLGQRQTLAGATLPRLFLPDLVASSNRLTRGFDLQFGLRNIFNHKYSDPVALYSAVDTMPQNGRTFFVTVVWHAPESSAVSRSDRKTGTPD